MPEIKFTVTDKMNELLDRLVEDGLFLSKADFVRFATIAYLKDMGWIEKLKD